MRCDDLSGERARRALDGLSVGEAFGQRVTEDGSADLVERRAMPQGRWRYGSATETGRAALETLEAHGEVDQEALVRGMAARMQAEPYRHWSEGTRKVLDAVRRGLAWQIVAPAVGEGGSTDSDVLGRSLVIGAYYAEDVEEATAQARAAAEITHAHDEALSAASAAAAAAAIAWRLRDDASRWAGPRLLDAAVTSSSPGSVRDALERAAAIRLDRPPAYAAQILGTGASGRVVDTLPYALWCAARHLDGYPGALWTAVSLGGDTAMLAAIAGGMAALAVKGGVPIGWMARREALPTPAVLRKVIAEAG